MPKFIKVNMKNSGRQVLLPTNKITDVFESWVYGSTCVVVGKWFPEQYLVKETVEEIMEMING